MSNPQPEPLPAPAPRSFEEIVEPGSPAHTASVDKRFGLLMKGRTFRLAVHDGLDDDMEPVFTVFAIGLWSATALSFFALDSTDVSVPLVVGFFSSIPVIGTATAWFTRRRRRARALANPVSPAEGLPFPAHAAWEILSGAPARLRGFGAPETLVADAEARIETALEALELLTDLSESGGDPATSEALATLVRAAAETDVVIAAYAVERARVQCAEARAREEWESVRTETVNEVYREDGRRFVFPTLGE